MPFLIVKSDWRRTKTPPMPTISPKTSNKICETAILFNVVEKSGNYVFENDKPPTPLRVNVVSYALETYKVFIDSVVVETSKRAHSIGN